MKSKIAIFGAGCFWGVEEAFSKLYGVLITEAGYMGGDEKKYPSPTYEQVCSDRTGYAEVIRVTYDEDKLSYDSLLDLFWKIHNPTTKNRQGPDFGSQYRSLIFYFDKEQKRKAESSMKEEQKKYRVGIVTEILNGNEHTFFRAEDYHQKYNEKHKGSFCRI